MNLQQAIDEAPSGATLTVPAGRYPGPLHITRPISLLAMGQAVLDGLHAGSVVRIECEGTVRLTGFTIVGGNATEAGGGVSVFSGDVELEQCVLRFNKAPLYGGGAVWVREGTTRLSRCRLEANTGRQGGALLVDGTAQVLVRDSAILQNAALEGGGIRVKEGARLELFGCTVADNKVVGDAAVGGALAISGTTTRAPAVIVSHCVLSERAEGPPCVHNAPRLPGALTLVHNLLPPWCASLGGDNRFAPAGFVMAGSEPYQLTAESPAVGAAEAGAWPRAARDVLGRPRLQGDGPGDLGAFAFTGASGGSLPY